jgi:hypothetical protein
VLLAAAILLVVLWPTAAPSTGSLTASERETVAIGDRATAVAEAGATLTWEVEADGEAHVRQSSGAVFYRVDAGDAFSVDTPAGRVTVTGTCFTVELDAMNSKLKTLASAAAGAAVATGVFLTVHEGSVVLANDHGDVEVVAGQRARARPGEAPSIADELESAVRATIAKPARDTRFKSLVRENQAQREELRRLHTELRERERDVAGGDAPQVDIESPEHRREVAQQCGEHGGCDRKLWTDPSQEELVELAKCGRLLVDTPAFMGGADFFPGGMVIEAAGLSEADSMRYAEIAEAYQTEVASELAGLASELGVPASLVERMSPVQLQGLVDSVVEADTHEAIRRRVADERAGIGAAPPVDQQSAGERALRFLWSQGQAFEHRLSAEFGADAAREMRHAAGGWANKSSIGGGDCRQ